jgi:hypothetical protein
LNVSRSNNDPSVVLRFYLDCVDENEGCPLIVQSDCGTENGNIAAAQCYFRVDATDEYAGEKAHRYGESKRNQRIEAWWSCFKKSRSSWWINLFKDLMDSGQFEYGNVIHKECMWFCFSDIIQEDLNYTRALWNITTTFDPQGTRLFQVGQMSCITYQNAMTVRIRNNL